MGAFYFNEFYLHDDEALRFILKYIESDDVQDAEARYVAQRLVDACPRLLTDAQNLYVLDEPGGVRKFDAVS